MDEIEYRNRIQMEKQIQKMEEAVEWLTKTQRVLLNTIHIMLDNQQAFVSQMDKQPQWVKEN